MRLSEGVLILGAGPIGTGMAAVMRAAGAPVTLCDPGTEARDAAEAAVARHIAVIDRAGHPRRADLGPMATIASTDEAAGVALVIEAGPEDRRVKARIFEDLLTRQPSETVLASTSSAIPISEVLPDPARQARCLVAHPGNPPSLIRVLELVPGQGTAPETVETAAALFAAAGFDPVPLGAEVPGFVFNRLQSALLREAYRLVEEGVIGVDGVDRLVRDGLGPRWALSGPFETADLNTAGGIRGHAARMGPAYAAIGEARGEHHARWSDDLVTRVEAERRAVLPEAALPERRAWRETALADLLAARRGLLADSGA